MIPLSAEKNIAKVEDNALLDKVDEVESGSGESNPHGHWLNCGIRDRIVSPNVWRGLGPAGLISILDTLTGDIKAEISQVRTRKATLLCPLLLEDVMLREMVR